MPYYAGLRRKDPATRKRIADGLTRLRAELRAQKIPQKTLGGDVLIASWNIREFDSPKYGERTDDAIYYIAEILSHFDLIAIQEVRENLEALDDVKRLLGSWWKYLVTDVTAGTSGNGERMAFLYDGRKVTFDGLAGEIVLPGSVKEEVIQFARTPYICGFRAGWARIDLCTVHIYYGDDTALNERRLQEISKLATFLAKRAAGGKDTAGAAATASPPTSNTLILLGDFNIFSNGDETLKAITDAGFQIPPVLLDRTEGSNIARDKFYDQIAVWQGSRFGVTEVAGVFDFYKAVFRAEDAETYELMITAGESGRKSYKDWRTYQMSDHLVLWAAFKVDFADEYLEGLAKD